MSSCIDDAGGRAVRGRVVRLCVEGRFEPAGIAPQIGVVPEKVEKLGRWESPIRDAEIEKFLAAAKTGLPLRA